MTVSRPERSEKKAGKMLRLTLLEIVGKIIDYIFSKEEILEMKNLKKLLCLMLAAVMLSTMSIPVFADDDDNAPKVYVSFVYNGKAEGRYVKKGANVKAPKVPELEGYTFCGWDKSLKNVQENTQFNAVYMINSAGEAAIEAKRNSLPSPAKVKKQDTAAAAAPANTDEALKAAAAALTQNLNLTSEQQKMLVQASEEAKKALNSQEAKNLANAAAATANQVAANLTPEQQAALNAAATQAAAVKN